MRQLFLGFMLLCANAVAGPRVLVHGDSLSAAYGLAVDKGWVHLLQQRCACQVINASQSGETTAGGLTRLPALLRQHQPDVLVIELGANDGLRALPLDLAEANLARMIELGQKAGARVLLVATAMPPNLGRSYGQRYQALFPRLAQRYQLPSPPFLLEGFASDLGSFQADGLHPIAERQPRMLDNVWSTLQPLLVAPGRRQGAVR